MATIYGMGLWKIFKKIHRKQREVRNGLLYFYLEMEGVSNNEIMNDDYQWNQV